MPRLRLDLDRETFEALADQAFAERRPVPLQAEVILRQALGLKFPYPVLRADSELHHLSPRSAHD
jgi:hypothetical protein